jgi:hypothetical protein
MGWHTGRVRRPSLESIEEGFGLVQIDAAFDQVDHRLDLGFLLDLLLD